MREAGLIDRRSLLGAATAASAVALSAAPSLAAKTASGDARAGGLTDPSNRGEIYRKLVWTLGEGFGCWSITGTRYAVIGAETTPLWDMHFGAMFLVRDLPDGNYEVAVISVQFYTDLKTGAFVRKFTNPITGVNSEIQYRPPKVSKTQYNAMGPIDPRSAIGVREARVGPVVVGGGRVWMNEEHTFKGPPSATGKGFRATDMTTYSAPVEVMTNRRIRMAPSQQSFCDVLDWPAWFGMGDLKGNQFSQTYGYKVAAIDQMSEPLHRLIKQEYPDLYRDPVAALKA